MTTLAVIWLISIAWLLTRKIIMMEVDSSDSPTVNYAMMNYDGHVLFPEAWINNNSHFHHQRFDFDFFLYL